MKQAYIFTLLAVALWTTGPIGSKAALLAERDGTKLTATQVAFWGVALGWIGLVVALAVKGRLRRLGDISGRGWLVLVGMGLTGWVGYQVFLNMAYERLSLATAMVISYLNPVFVLLFQGAPFGRMVRLISHWEQEGDCPRHFPVLRLTVGLGLCLLGVAVIVTGGRMTLEAPKSVVGVMAALFGALAWGIYSNLGRFVAVRPGREARGLGDVQNLGAMAIGLLIMALGLAKAGQLAPPMGFTTTLYLAGPNPREVEVWIPIIVMALLNYCGGYTLWLYAVEQGERAGQAHKLPPLTYLVLVTAVALGWVFFREPFEAGFWQGTGLIALGNAVTLWPGRSQTASLRHYNEGEVGDRKPI